MYFHDNLNHKLGSKRDSTAIREFFKTGDWSLKLRALGALGRSSAIFEMGYNFCDFLFAFLHAKPLLKMGLL